MKPPNEPVTIKKPQQKPATAATPKKKFELNSKNMRLLLVCCLMLLIFAFIATAFLGLSTLSGKSASLVDLRSKSQQADNELLNLEQSKKDVQKYAYFKDIAKTVIPNDKDQAETILEIFQMANDAGISIQSITFPNSNLGLRTTASSATDATKASASTVISQATPVAGIAGLYSVPLIITPDTSSSTSADKQVTFAKMLKFMNDIENDRRTAQITDVAIQPSANSVQTLSFTLTVNVFIRP